MSPQALSVCSVTLKPAEVSRAVSPRAMGPWGHGASPQAALGRQRLQPRPFALRAPTPAAALKGAEEGPSLRGVQSCY